MTLQAAGFWAVAVALLGCSLAVVLTPNLFHAVLFLAGALVATGLVFLLLDAPFLFGVQLLLYAGGVVTILVFAIMLTERLVGARIAQTSRYLGQGAIVAAASFAGIAGFLVGAAPPPGAAAAATPVTGIAHALTGPFAASFELLAVLLLAALVGAIYFARPED